MIWNGRDSATVVVDPVTTVSIQSGNVVGLNSGNNGLNSGSVAANSSITGSNSGEASKSMIGGDIDLGKL